MMNRVTELLLGGNVRHLHARAVGGVLPTMIRATNAVFLDAAKIERRQTVLAVSADQTNLSFASAEQHQVFAKQPYPERFDREAQEEMTTESPRSNTAGTNRPSAFLDRRGSVARFLLW